jgi:CHAT domain-containing protein
MIGRAAWLGGLSVLCLFAQRTTSLTRGAAVDRQITGGEAHEYRLSLAAGEFAGLTVEQRGIDVVIQVLDPAGKPIAEFDAESRKQGRELAGVVADPAGNYSLRIKPVYSRQAPGHYEIRLAEVRAATAADRARFASHKLAGEASARQDRGAYDEAIPLFERALESAEIASATDEAYAGELLFRIASLKRLKGDYAAAQSLFERAVAADQKALGREDPQTAVALRGWGNLFLATAEYAKAEPLLQESLEIFERTLGGQHPNIALCLRLLGNLHGYLEDLERSRTYLQRALVIAEKTFDPDDVSLIAVVHDLGDIYRMLGDNDNAEPLLERTLAFVEKKYGPEHIQLASPLHNLGSVAFDRKEYQRALELYGRAHAIREKVLGAQHPDTARILTSMANVYGVLGDGTRSLELHQKALDLLTVSAGPYHRSTLVALEGVGRSYARLGDFARAIQFQERFDEALEKEIGWNLTIGSDREKLAYLKWISSQTDRTVSLHSQHAPDNPAARDLAALVLLQRKGRALDAMSGSMTALRQRLNAADRKLLDELGETDAKLANLSLAGPMKISRADWEKQLADLEERRERLEFTVSDRSGEFRAQSQPVALAALRAAIPLDAALLEFASYRTFDPGLKESLAYGESRYVVYVLRREGDIRWCDIGPANEIDSALAALREALRDSRRQNVRELARAADRKIMQPVRALAGEATQLLISPDGTLNLIPFEALVDEQGEYLLERYSISYLTTGRDLLRMQVTRTSRSGPVVVANPFFGEPLIAQAAGGDRHRSISNAADLSTVYFTPLAGTAEEARGIKSLFPEAEMFTGRRASKASLKRLEAPSILHIATHGFFLSEAADARGGDTRAIRANVKIDNPLLRSGLALAGANLSSSSDDGVLTALEASGLNLWGTKVVTLSACETGLGEVRNGEGVYGLRRAFFLAGAQTLVMSLWPVNDRVTRETMTAYYTGLKNGLGRGEALRQAQLAMLRRKDRQHPFYWAGFIQSGDWRNLDGR